MTSNYIYCSKNIGNVLNGYESELCGVDPNKRNNCGFVASTLASFLNNKGISANQVRGYFKVDIPDTSKKSFTPDELIDMKINGFNVNDVNDRIQYSKKQGIFDELFYIPHSWVYTDRYGIIDPTIKRFKPYMKSNISDKNYKTSI